jgi:hypothetical protein
MWAELIATFVNWRPLRLSHVAAPADEDTRTAQSDDKPVASNFLIDGSFLHRIIGPSG